MQVLINVKNQKLRLCQPLNKLIDGTQEFVKFQFDLDKDWKELTVFAQFRQDGNSYNAYLDTKKCVYLPPEIKAGTCTMMLYGSANTTIATSNYLTFTIDENILIQDAQSTEISQSLYNQLVTKDQETQKKIENMQSQLNNLAKNEIVRDAIYTAVELEMEMYLSSGKLAAMTIRDGTLSRAKVDDDFKATLEKADTAMQPAIYDTQGVETDIFAYYKIVLESMQILESVQAYLSRAEALYSSMYLECDGETPYLRSVTPITIDGLNPLARAKEIGVDFDGGTPLSRSLAS